jgi:hypothetical protein
VPAGGRAAVAAAKDAPKSRAELAEELRQAKAESNRPKHRESGENQSARRACSTAAAKCGQETAGISDATLTNPMRLVAGNCFVGTT